MRTYVLLSDWSNCVPIVTREQDLVVLAYALGANDRREVSAQDKLPLARQPAPAAETVLNIRSAILRGEDPLGEMFCRFYSAEERRKLGAVYTPLPIVHSMLAWAENSVTPVRVVDPGCGSGRFLVEGGRRFRDAQLIGVEIDPVAAMLAEANLAAAGMGERSTILVDDYRRMNLPAVEGPTLFIGNPPYVRHHAVPAEWKRWLVERAREQGLAASQLAGLHIHFLLATARLARAGDAGIFITAAEWLDVNYGSLARDLLLNNLGLQTVQLIDPRVEPFPGTAATGVIFGFRVGGESPAVRVRSVTQVSALGKLDEGRSVPRKELGEVRRWTTFTRPAETRRKDFVELGEYCRVHRGQATGANDVWIANGKSHDLPVSVLLPTVTRAKELLTAGDVLSSAAQLRCVIDLPANLEGFDDEQRRHIEKYLHYAKQQGADQTYIAQHRKPWWSVGLRKPAPILATYMARRPPVFVRNLAQARHINIAHGLYPRIEMDDLVLDALARFLMRSVTLHSGRSYAGGLTKFEPREMERLLVPPPEILAQQIPYEELMR
jgi:adenine-specific DNA-methyltransferase